jgi:hypothetical protein
VKRTRIVLLAAGAVYGLFAVACFRLAALHGYERGVSLGEGVFALLGAVAFFVAALGSRRQALVVCLGTVPLVAWFLATPWNSGPPFLIAALLAPALAAAAVLLRARFRFR